MVNQKYTEEQFYQDLSWISQMPRGHIVQEIYEKWRDRCIFDD